MLNSCVYTLRLNSQTYKHTKNIFICPNIEEHIKGTLNIIWVLTLLEQRGVTYRKTMNEWINIYNFYNTASKGTEWKVGSLNTRCHAAGGDLGVSLHCRAAYSPTGAVLCGPAAGLGVSLPYSPTGAALCGPAADLGVSLPYSPKGAELCGPAADLEYHFPTVSREQCSVVPLQEGPWEYHFPTVPREQCSVFPLQEGTLEYHFPTVPRE